MGKKNSNRAKRKNVCSLFKKKEGRSEGGEKKGGAHLWC